MRNVDKLKHFVKLYDDGHIFYDDGKLYRVVGSIYNHGSEGERIEGTNLKRFDEPKPLCYLSTGNKRYYRTSITVDGKSVLAYEHIIIYAIFHGVDSLRSSHHIDHIDGDKHNNRIDNLELVTFEENNRRIIELDMLRPPRGEENGASVLTESDVLKIRDLYSRKEYNQYELSGMFGVTQGNISEIVNRKRWAHI